MTELLVDAGSRVDLGTIIATIASDADDLLGDLDLDPGDGTNHTGDRDTREAAVTTEALPAVPQAAPRIAAPPPVRKRAKRLGIDLTVVPATGSRGHVTHADLTRFLEQQGDGDAAAAAPSPAVRAASPAVRAATPAVRAATPSTSPPAARNDAGTADRRRTVRRATARVTSRSAAIPQFTLHRRIDLTAARERRGGRSWTTELARALAAALWRHPACNARWDDEREETVPFGGVRIGVAVDSRAGLVVVGVDDPDADDPAYSDRRVRDAIDRARSGKVTVEDTQAVSSTISNLGGLGIDHFQALLLPPQPTMLSVGRISDTPVVIDGDVQIRPLIEVGLTVDHRVADGADGARLLETFARRLES